MIFEQKNFGSGEPGQDCITDRADCFLQSTKLRHDFRTLGGGRSVAPKFCGADDFAVFVERNETMLLSADADGLNFGRAGLGLSQRQTNGRRRRVAPGVWM